MTPPQNGWNILSAVQNRNDHDGRGLFAIEDAIGMDTDAPYRPRGFIAEVRFMATAEGEVRNLPETFAKFGKNFLLELVAGRARGIRVFPEGRAERVQRASRASCAEFALPIFEQCFDFFVGD